MSIVIPRLKRIHSPDVVDLDNPTIDQTGPFCVLVQAMFGPEGGEGEESFDILVCNPAWVAQRASEGVFSGRHHLVVLNLNTVAIRSFLIESARACSAATWNEVAEKLARIGKWEFEDYKA